MKTKQQILDEMALFQIPDGGIGAWLTKDTHDDVFQRLGKIESEPLPAVQLNQLLVLAHEAPVTDGFFQYYWLKAPNDHPYIVQELPGFRDDWLSANTIQSLEHLRWGLYRLYVDALLYFGNVRSAFRGLRELSYAELRHYFFAKRIDTRALKQRGPALPLKHIDKDKRYLIAEMACKSYGENPKHTSDLRTALTKAYKAHVASDGSETTVEDLLRNRLPQEFRSRQDELIFSATEILDQSIDSEGSLRAHYEKIAERFSDARNNALKNTRLYLSMLADLDVYVATSMRTREDFFNMADVCDTVFADSRLVDMNLRYFDPTLSAAAGHEDKGLIECLMVKCARVLVYCAGKKDSYGKDAEAAMALSLGRPVIFYCDEEQRSKFYRDVHPLSRLIEFDTGVAVGAMVTDKLDEVAELLCRILENRMSYRLEQPKEGFLRLKEEVTGSVVRLQTDDKLLTETFWNQYHQDRAKKPGTAIADVVELRPDASIPITTRIQQAELPLEEPNNLVQQAARSTRPSEQRDSQEKKGSIPKEVRFADRFPLSEAEVFDGVSKIKTNQVTGTKRCRVFVQWLKEEGIDIVEGVKLLRFVEITLQINNARSGYVYKSSDLTRWYRQMSNGEASGSMT